MKITYGERQDRLYSKLYVSHMDIGFARQCAAHLLKKGWHGRPWERRGTIYFQQVAFTSALITSYARPFTKSEGWPALPKKVRSAFSQEEDALHASLITLRHQVYAHSDSASYSIQPWSSQGFSTDIVSDTTRRLTAEEATTFLTMSTKLLDAIYVHMKDLKAAPYAKVEGDLP